MATSISNATLNAATAQHIANGIGLSGTYMNPYHGGIIDDMYRGERFVTTAVNVEQLAKDVAEIKQQLAILLPIVERDPMFAQLKATYDAYYSLKELLKGTENAKDVE